jgi:hypothetical protein
MLDQDNVGAAATLGANDLVTAAATQRPQVIEIAGIDGTHLHEAAGQHGLEGGSDAQ